jgi:uncharacterized membrane protein
MTPNKRLFWLFAAASVWCGALVATRVGYTGKVHYAFLLWNLFLALVPLACSEALLRSRRTVSACLLLAVWLLFFPNAIYIVTDLIHIRKSKGLMAWFDLIMILSFAMVALHAGFLSLSRVQSWVTRRSNAVTGWAVVLATCVLSGFGVYLGRFLRWNSWDIVSRPFSLLSDIAARVVSPVDHINTWLATAGIGGFTILAYVFWSQLTPSTIESRS